jgi:hypothetical protein
MFAWDALKEGMPTLVWHRQEVATVSIAYLFCDKGAWRGVKDRTGYHAIWYIPHPWLSGGWCEGVRAAQVYWPL